MLQIEQHLSHYGIKSSKRADIVIEKYEDESTIVPLAVIECKAPDVPLDERAIKQAINYCDDLLAEYIMLTNGNSELFFRYDESKNTYIEIKCLPTYTEMLKGKAATIPPPQPFTRLEFEKIKTHIQALRKNLNADDYFTDISIHTPIDKAILAYNFMETLLDTSYRLKPDNYGYFSIIEDYGTREMTYGNASGGIYSGPYRTFLIEKGGNAEFVSLAIIAYNQTDKPLKTNTCIAVAIDSEKTSHHALQYSLEENLTVSGAKCDFYHSGKISVGNIGSSKSSGLIEYIKSRDASLIEKDKIMLGTLYNERLWKITDEDFAKLVVNFISYALLRDEYRQSIKAKNKGDKV